MKFAKNYLGKILCKFFRQILQKSNCFLRNFFLGLFGDCFFLLDNEIKEEGIRVLRATPVYAESAPCIGTDEL